MRKVTYINEFGKSITFGDELPYFLEYIDGSGLGAATEVYKSYGDDGQRKGITTLEARTILCDFIFAFRGTAENYRKKWVKICDIFNPKLNGTLFYEDDGGSYKIGCRPFELPKKITNQKFSMQFVADSPFWQAKQGFYQKLGTVVGGLKLPLSFNPKIKLGTWIKECTIDNDTSVETPFVITVESVSDYCKITNQKGEFIKIDKPIGAGEKLVIDTGNYNVKLYFADGSFIYANNKITLDSTYLKLYAGENTLTLDNGQATLATASIEYNKLFVGV